MARRVTGPNSSRVHLERWVREAAELGSEKSFFVLDAGAGTAPYRDLFGHVSYETADFAKVAKHYAPLDYVCDLREIPVEDGRYDLVIATQVMEHVPEPLAVLREFRRVLKPGGQLWASAPLFYEEHEQPYDFYRYTQFAWRRFGEELNLKLLSLDWLEGYDGTLAYQLGLAARSLPNRQLHWRVVFALLARYFGRRDIRRKDTARGMCKNFKVVFQKPLEPGDSARGP